MKILQINKFFYLRGGAERHYFDLMKLLEEKGHEIIHFSMQDDRNRPSPYADYFVSNLELGVMKPSLIRALPRGFYSREAARKLAALIDATKPDVAHVHLIYHHLTASVLNVLRAKKIPIVMTVHDFKLVCPNYMMYARGEICEHCRTPAYYKTITHRCLKNSYLVSALAVAEAYLGKWFGWYTKGIGAYITGSHFLKDLLISSAGLEASRVHVLYHFSSIAPRIALTKGEPPYVLSASRLSEEKGVLFLVKTWIEKKVSFPLYLAGTGPLEQELKKMIADAGAGNVIKLLGFLDDETLREYMRRATVFVAPSLWYETFGLSIAEAMAHGVPVITTNHGAQNELIKQSGAGMAIAPGDDGALAAAVADLMNNAPLREKMGLAGVAFVKNELDKEAYYEKIMKLYERVINYAVL